LTIEKGKFCEKSGFSSGNREMEMNLWEEGKRVNDGYDSANEAQMCHEC
jgi:hypothetical protein